MIQLVSSTEPVFRVLVSRRHVVHWDSTTLAYRVECFLSLPLDPLVTLSSSHFTRGKSASKCDITFERYRIFKFFVKGQKLRDDSVTITLKIIAQILFEEFFYFIPQNFPVITTYIATVCSWMTKLNAQNFWWIVPSWGYSGVMGHDMHHICNYDSMIKQIIQLLHIWQLYSWYC